MATIKIFPSLISANMLHLEEEVRRIEPHCDGLHIDVMDNHFVPNLTWGPTLINAIAKICTKPLFVHLMVEDPIKFLHQLQLPAKTICSIHIESEKNYLKFIKFSKENNLIPSIAIKPKTPLQENFKVLQQFDHVLLMSVEPGFSGQRFLESSVSRLKELVQFKHDHHPNLAIAMDGGINATNLRRLVQAGVDEVAIASGIYGQPDTLTALRELYAIADEV